MLEFRDISLKRNQKQILSQSSFSVQPGEKIVITGDSGSGKTTILNLIMGLTVADSGTILFENKAVDSNNIAHIRSRIAYIGQEPSPAAESIREALLLPFTFKANLRNRPDEKIIDEVLDFLLLDKDIQTKKSSQVSGGEKQRIAIARAMLMGKKVFLADEITSALDNNIIKQLYRLFGNKEYTLISVSHDRNWIEFCDRVMHLKDGSLTEAAI